jgi:hypothetical protein
MQNQPIHPINSIFIDRELCTNPNVGNNAFTFNFARTVTTTGTSRMGVSNFSVPYSWFNITAQLGNNKLGYIWYDSSTYTAAGLAGTFGYPPIDNPQLNSFLPANSSSGTQFNFTIPDGFYTLATLNSYLQFVMIQNGHYAIDTLTGNYIYFLEIAQNTIYYRDQVNSYLLPGQGAIPATWTKGAAVSGVPGTGYDTTGNVPGYGHPNPPSTWPAPKLVLSNQGLGVATLFDYLGFNSPSPTPAIPYQLLIPANNTAFPTNYTVISTLGDVAPNQSTTHSLCLTCDFIDNPLRTNAGQSVSTFVVTTQNIDVPFGEDIAKSNLFINWIPLLGGQTLNKMNFQLLNQDGTPVLLQDDDTNIELLITDLRYN